MSRNQTNNDTQQRLNRRDTLRLLAAAAAGGMAGNVTQTLATAAAERPNIIFILGDNHNVNDMGFVGHPFIKTPGMDRLAREGVHFANTFNTTSLCSPSRASILTGAYAHSHGVRNNHTPWTGQMTTFLEHLKRAGYDTAFLGKWHMPGRGLPDMPFLDLFVSYTYREGQGAYFNCPLIVNGKETPSRKPYITEEITDWALEFMKQERTDKNGGRKPFCMYVSHRPAHPPFRAPADIEGMYDHEKVEMPPGVDPLWFGKTDYNVYQGVMMGTYPDQYRKYCETITAMDRDIVRLLDAVDQPEFRDNTVVIYMADNGMQWGAHGRHGIREPYEDSIRVPFMVRAPGLVADPGSKREQMALNIDIAPTLLDLAGVPVPEEMDGQSMLPALRDKNSRGRDAFLVEYWRYYPENTPTYVGVRTQTQKYVEFEKGRKPWLFDLEKDPQELKNLYGTKRGDVLLPGLRDKLEKLLAGRSREFRPGWLMDLSTAALLALLAGGGALLGRLIMRRQKASVQPINKSSEE